MTTDLPPSDPDGRASAGTNGSTPAGMPRWVKVFGIVGLVLLLFVLVTLLLGINHGPGMHGLGVAPQTVSSAPSQSLR